MTGAVPRRFGWAVVGIVVTAFLLRLGYLYQIEGLPFFYHPIGDAKSYWEWAGRIAGGDWIGNEAFYQAPGYPYFLAAVRSITGDDLWRARMVQIVMGSISCGLLALAGRRFFSASAGLWTGAIMALYGPAIFFDGLIQKAGLSLLLMSGVLCLMGRFASGGRSFSATVAASLVLGVLLGILALTVEQALLLVPVVAVWIISGQHRAHSFAPPEAVNAVARSWPSRPEDGGGKPRRSLRVAALLAGCGVMLGTVAWRNHHVSGVWALTTVQAGPNFYIGNHEHATGRYVPLVPGHETPEFERRDAVELAEAALGRKLNAEEVSRYWSGQAWAWVREHPGAWLKLLATKWLLVWNAYEIPDTESYTLYRDFSWVLGVVGRIGHFGVLCPLAVLGVVCTAGQWRRVWPLYAMVAVLACGVAAFYVFGRYRYPLSPLLAIFAGAGAAEIHGLIRLRSSSRPLDGGRKARRSLVMFGVLGLAAVATNLRINPERRLDALAYANLGAVLGQRGNYDGAVHCLEEALAGAPDSVDARFNLAMAYRLRGDRERALAEFRRVQDLDPRRIEVDFQLGRLYEALGGVEEAKLHYRRALEIDPHDTQAREGLNRMLTAKTPSTPRTEE